MNYNMRDEHHTRERDNTTTGKKNGTGGAPSSLAALRPAFWPAKAVYSPLSVLFLRFGLPKFEGAEYEYFRIFNYFNERKQLEYF